MPVIQISGIVSARNMQPYVCIDADNARIGQLTMAEARNVAHDILSMCARTEADAMIVRFFGQMEFPQAACAALLNDFRNFRSELDKEPVVKTEDTGEASPNAKHSSDA